MVALNVQLILLVKSILAQETNGGARVPVILVFSGLLRFRLQKKRTLEPCKGNNRLLEQSDVVQWQLHTKYFAHGSRSTHTMFTFLCNLASGYAQ